jgi:hypothetical protein
MLKHYSNRFPAIEPPRTGGRLLRQLPAIAGRLWANCPATKACAQRGPRYSATMSRCVATKAPLHRNNDPLRRNEGLLRRNNERLRRNSK